MNNMAIKSLVELHLKMHKLMHPFDHIAHGALVFAIFFMIKTIIGLFIITTVHISATILFLGFVITTTISVFAERKFLKKEIETLKRKL